MRRPTWATAVGIIGIILGLLGLFGSANTILMPKVMEMQKEVITAVQEDMEGEDAPPEEFMDIFNLVLDAPDWFGSWSIVVGLIGLIISGFYIFASVSLLLVKKSAIKIFYWVIGICIGYTLLKGIVAISAMPFIGTYIMVSGVIGIVIDVILLIVVATGDKQAFLAKESA